MGQEVTTSHQLPHRSWFAEVPKNSRNSLLTGYAILVIGVFGFSAWAYTAPIDGAIVAPGVFVATGKNKVVQHLEGGIIRSLLVHDGDIVKKGQPLVVLDPTTADADLNRLKVKEFQLTAQIARLTAEEQLKRTVDYGPRFSEISNSTDRFSTVMAQRNIFRARWEKFDTEIGIHRQSIEAAKKREKSLEQQIAATKDQIELILEELRDTHKLFVRGYSRKPQYLALKRAHARLQAKVSELKGELESGKEESRSLLHQIDRIKKIFVQTAAEERHLVLNELKDVQERIRSQKDMVTRQVIRAPVGGRVIKLNYHTPGGVVKPGGDILTLLPLEEELVIETRVRPRDIDSLADNREALIRLTALNQRLTPMIEGRVYYVSADTLPDDKARTFDQENAFILRVALDPEYRAILPDFEPTPGMPAEVLIKTGSRTFLQYIMQPVMDSMMRAFREA